jgi:hypothetical protein
VVGAALLVVGLVLIRGTTPYPGLWALLPVLATMALITAGHTWGGEVAPNRISSTLNTPPAQWLGRVSYSWYLWHWPAIILAGAAFDSTNVGLQAVAALWALGMAWLAYHYFETPVRFLPVLAQSNARTYAFGAAVTGVVLLVAFAVTPSTPTVPDAQAQLHATSVAALEGPANASLQEQVAREVSLYQQRAAGDCPTRGALTDADGDRYCVGGDLAGTTSIMLLGDSHAGQWRAEVEQLAKADHLKLLIRQHDGCPPFPVNVTDPSNSSARTKVCQVGAAGDLRAVAALKPEAVIVATWNGYMGNILDASGHRVPADEQAQLWQKGVLALFRSIRSAGAKIGFIYDEPTLPIDASKCIAGHNAVAPCVQTRAAALALTQPVLDAEHQAVEQTGHLATLDMPSKVCTATSCPLMVGHTLVYVDTHHLTAAFALSQLRSVKALLEQTLAEPR